MKSRSVKLIGGDLDQMVIDMTQPDDLNLTPEGYFSLPSHLPDGTVVLNVYESLALENEKQEELFCFRCIITMRPRKSLIDY
jgi:hypothetical protein